MEIASFGGLGVLNTASSTAPSRLFTPLLCTPPRPHPPKRIADRPSSSNVSVWLHLAETFTPAAITISCCTLETSWCLGNSCANGRVRAWTGFRCEECQGLVHSRHALAMFSPSAVFALDQSIVSVSSCFKSLWYMGRLLWSTVAPPDNKIRPSGSSTILCPYLRKY